MRRLVVAVAAVVLSACSAQEVAPTKSAPVVAEAPAIESHPPTSIDERTRYWCWVDGERRYVDGLACGGSH